MERFHSALSSLTRWAMMVSACLLVGGPAVAGPLEISTATEVDAAGQVGVTLHLENTGSTPLYHLHPMFHFHHTMASLPRIHALGPGEKVVIENHDHPPVVRRGSYPIVAMVHYRSALQGAPSQTAVHTDRFSYQKSLPSQIEGSIVATGDDDKSLLKVMLRNATPSFKNLHLMLVLPPQVHSRSFQGMKGFTLRSGEEKTFEIPLNKMDGLPGGQFPVHLLVEYGELMDHYSGEITGQVNFGPLWKAGPLWPHLLVFLFIGSALFVLVRKRYFKQVPVSC